MEPQTNPQAFDPASFEHIPVLLNECLDGLAIDPAGTYLDGTAGGAGHSRQIALRLDGAKGGRLISLDQDPDAVQTARVRLAGLPATVVQINFRYAGQALEQLGIEKINGALLDLGVSSHQLDDAARGFSYRADAPLDMRMSQEGETAADLVNTESREELARILRDYGEEPLPGRSRARSWRRGRRPPLKQRFSWPISWPVPCRLRSGAKTRTPRGARSRRCALRSTMSWTLWRRGWTPFLSILPRAGGCVSSHSTRWKTGW